MMGMLTIKRMNTFIFVLTLGVALSFSSAARSSTFDSLDSANQNSHYYVIDEDDVEIASLASPQEENNWSAEMMSATFIGDQIISSIKQIVVNLLKWTERTNNLTGPDEKYIRKLHFGRWINDPHDDTCMNTRARVLTNSSQEEVSYRGNKRCVVDSGLWHEPYAGKVVRIAREIQIDHIVPLKNAYVSGAWQWDYKTRCLFANYMGYNNHLVPSDASQNMSKGDRAPDKFLPANENYRCQYVKDWLAVKLIWKLNMTPEEVQAIADVVQEYQCDSSTFKFTQAELQKQRDEIYSNIDFCMINKR